MTEQDKRFTAHKKVCVDCNRSNLYLCSEGERLHNIAVSARIKVLQSTR